MPEVSVPVTWVAQEELYLCGPAAAQMLLSALGAPNPPGPPTWQLQLWDQVKSHTGARRPKDAGEETPYAPAFKAEKCERCSSTEDWNCWATTPVALKNILNLGQGVAVFKVGTRTTEESVTGLLLDALDDAMPGAALIHGWAHWVVVDGYVHDNPNGTTVAGRQVNGVYVRDPDGAASLHYVTYDSWRDNYLSVVPCGTYQDKFVVVVGAK